MGFIHDEVALLQQQDTSADVADGVQVVAGNKDGRAEVPVHFPDQPGDHDLGARVQVVERLVQDEDPGTNEHRADDADLLAVAVGEVVEQLPGSQDLPAHQRLEVLQPQLDFGLGNPIHFADEAEVLLRRIEIDQERGIQEGAREALPGIVLVHALSVDGDVSAAGLDQIQHQAHHRRLAGAVVADQAHQFPFAHGQLRDIQRGDTAVLFAQVGQGNHIDMYFSMYLYLLLT